MTGSVRLLRSAAVLTLIGWAAGGPVGPLVSVVPGDHAHVTVAPRSVTLDFTAPIDFKRLTFKVYRFPLSTMMVGDRPMSGAQMDIFASQQARRMLTLKSDTADRVDTGAVESISGRRVVIGLKLNLSPGVYVTAWKLNGSGQKIGFVHFHFVNDGPP